MRLEISDISKTYSNGVKALDSVSLSVSHGMFGLLGPNGAGKTTLMNTLATLQDPDSGTIRLGETDALKDKKSVRRRLGYLPQEFGVYPGVSAEAMLDYLAELKGIADSKARRRHVAELLELVNLSAEKRRAVETFSGGMRQRFGVAQALIGAPDFIIVDEPTAGLDPMERNRFHNLLSEIGENTILILSTHIVEDISNLCDRMAIMNKGRIIAEGSPGELIENLRGAVWRKIAAKSDAHELKNRYNVIAMRMSAGKMVVTVHSSQCPDESFTPKTPDLEDVYFSTLPQQIGPSLSTTKEA